MVTGEVPIPPLRRDLRDVLEHVSQNFYRLILLLCAIAKGVVPARLKDLTGSDYGVFASLLSPSKVSAGNGHL